MTISLVLASPGTLTFHTILAPVVSPFTATICLGYPVLVAIELRTGAAPGGVGVHEPDAGIGVGVGVGVGVGPAAGVGPAVGVGPGVGVGPRATGPVSNLNSSLKRSGVVMDNV